MGEHLVKKLATSQERKAFSKALLNDILALEQMLKEGMIEKGIQRIGAEQELCLVDRNYDPSSRGPEILDKIRDPQYTTELAKYNLEINLDPQVLQGECFSKTRQQLEYLLNIGRDASLHYRNKILLTGILPTIRLLHLKHDFMSPAVRYKALSDSFLGLRGGMFEINLQGVDELIASLETVLFEACNTSFQMHLQIDPDEFAARYNWAQAIAGPIMAISTNSPLLMGRELWNETRIALFKQSLDTRSSSNQLRDKVPRVYFGNDWIRNSVTDIFKDQITRFASVITEETGEDSLVQLENGRLPKLRALMLHNGTTYPWNRPCYGVSKNIAHLRIEARYLPSGPTVVDEMANFALWVGLMNAMPEEFRSVENIGDFREVKANFVNAARMGMKTGLTWDGKIWWAPNLMSKVLLPMAEKGLKKVGINNSDINTYLGIIEGRCAAKQDGSTWQIRNYRKLKDSFGMGKALSILTKEMYQRQEQGKPVHEWNDIKISSFQKGHLGQLTAAKIMSTDLFTVKDTDFVTLAENIMKWQDIRHLPVENTNGELAGIITAKNLNRWWAEDGDPYAEVSKMMVKDVISVSPNTSIDDIRNLMFEYQIGCLPVIVKNKLVGIVTDTDVTKLEVE